MIESSGGENYTTWRIEGPDVLNPLDEAAGVNTNNAAQSSLLAIQILEMCADRLPASTSQ
jgi:hypothetical protein